MDLATNRRTPWRELAPADLAGVDSIGDVLLSPDGESSILSCVRVLTDLYLVEGLK